MAKINLNKLGLSINKEIEKIDWQGNIIEIKQYLPMTAKLELCTNIVNDCLDDQNFYNSGRIEVFMTVGILLAYTNINVTDKQKEDICKLYDLFASNGFKEMIYKYIPQSEKDLIEKIIITSIKNIYKYRNSALGILETMKTDYSNLELDAQNIQNILNQGDGLSLVKEVIDKLG